MHDISYQLFKNAKCKNGPKLVTGVFLASKMAACSPPPMHLVEKALGTRLLFKPGDIVPAISAS